MARGERLDVAAKRAVRRPAYAPVAGRELMDAPQRRSSRIEGKPARNYSESTLDTVERPERRSRLLDRHSARPVPSPLLTMGHQECSWRVPAANRTACCAAHLFKMQGCQSPGACIAP